MSVFKYLTLSHLQKVLSALETRFKGLDDKIDSVGKSDWAENDPTKKTYIENRTHYSESQGYMLLIDFTNDISYVEQEPIIYNNVEYRYQIVACNDYYEKSWYDFSTFQNGDLSDFDTTGTSTLMVDGNEYELINTYYSDWESIFAYNETYLVIIENNNIYIYSSESIEVESIAYTAKLVNEVFTYTKLNNAYLNGILIRKGKHYGSEIFNSFDKTEYCDSKEDLGSDAHIEGYAWPDECGFILNGEAGSNSYTAYPFYYDLNRVSLLLGREIISGSKKTECIIEDYYVSNDTVQLYLSKTLDDSSDIVDGYFEVYIPGSIASWQAHAEGCNTKAIGTNSHSEGEDTLASGENSHAEGCYTTAYGNYSHAEGYYTTASGIYSHAEGYYTTASGDRSHAEGYYTIASQANQHVQGKYNIEDTQTNYAHIVGNGTANTRSNAYTLDWNGNGVYAGKLTVGTAPTNNMDVATKKYVDDSVSGASGLFIVTVTLSNNIYRADKTFAEVLSAYDNGKAIYLKDGYRIYELTEIGNNNITFTCFHRLTPPSGNPYFILMYYAWNKTSGIDYYQSNLASSSYPTIDSLTDTTISSPSDGQVLKYDNATSKWVNSTFVGGEQSDWEETDTTDLAYIANKPAIRAGDGENSIVEGSFDVQYQAAVYTLNITGGTNVTTFSYTSSDSISLSSGQIYPAYCEWSDGERTHYTGTIVTDVNTTNHTVTLVEPISKSSPVASGVLSIYKNYRIAKGKHSHAEGIGLAIGVRSHAEGAGNAISTDSHAEGSSWSMGNDAHAEGGLTKAIGDYSHSEGYRTIAHYEQHVQGKYNIEDSNSTYAHIVGNGDYNAPSNAHTLDWSGNGWYAGKLTVGAAPTNNMDVATKQYVDNAMGSATTTISGLTDTTITSVANGDVLIYDSTSSKWINSNLTTIVNTAVATALAEYGDGDTASYGITDGNEVSY